MVVRYATVDLDHSTLVDDAVLFHGTPCVSTNVVLGFEQGDFFVLLPEELPLDERFRADRALLLTEVEFRRPHSDVE